MLIYNVSMGKRMDRPTEESLYHAYVTDELGIAKVADRFGVSFLTAFRWLKKANVPMRNVGVIPGRTHRPAEVIDRIRRSERQTSWDPGSEEMQRLYLVENLCLREIAVRVGVSTSTVGKRLREYGIPAKPPQSDGRFLFTKGMKPMGHLPPKYSHPRGHHGYLRLVFDVENRPKVCVECGSTKNIHVHHIDEDREHNSSENLIVLCKSCHWKAHNRGQFFPADRGWSKRRAAKTNP